MSDKPVSKRHAPDKLLVNFTKTKFLSYLAIAVGVHLVLMLLTSITYIRVEWFGAEPPATKTKEEVADKSAEASDEPVAEVDEQTPASESGQKTNEPDDVVREMVGGSGGARVLKEAKDSEIVKEITETAKPEEIPDVPDELGISIEDTNPK